MFSGKSSNDEINRVQKKALRIVHNDYASTFEELLKKGNHLQIHHINNMKLLVRVLTVRK